MLNDSLHVDQVDIRDNDICNIINCDNYNDINLDDYYCGWGEPDTNINTIDSANITC